MCVALPGKVVSIEGREARVDFNGNMVKAKAGFVEVEIGDYVLVHAGCILQKVSEVEAKEMAEIFREIDEESLVTR